MQTDKDLELVNRVALRQAVPRGDMRKESALLKRRPQPLPVALVKCPCGATLALAERMGVNNRRCDCGRQYTLSTTTEREPA